jgi:hypothetical protein
MEIVPKLMFIVQGLFWIFLLVVLIYLIFRRVDIKKREDFEDRDN